jgi:hypothetical protein
VPAAPTRGALALLPVQSFMRITYQGALARAWSLLNPYRQRTF